MRRDAGLYIPPREHPHRTPARHRARGRAPGRRPVARRRGGRRPRHPAHLRPARRRGAGGGAGLRRQRSATGRPGLGVGAEHPPVDRRRARALRGRRRARAPEHPLQGHGGRVRAAHVGRRFLFTVTDFLDTDYVALLEEAGAAATWSRRSSCSRARAAPAPSAGTTSWRAAACGRRRRGGDARAALTGETMSDIIFTSGTTGAPKGAMLRHGASVRGCTTSWADVVGLRHGDRYLIVNPFFHAVRAEGRHGRASCSPARRAPPPGVRHAVGDGHGAGGADHDAPGTARDLPDHPQLPTRAYDFSSLRWPSPAPRSSRGADRADARATRPSSPW